MKVMMLCDSYLPLSRGGTEIFCHSLSVELQRQGVRVGVVAHSSSSREAFAIDGVPVDLMENNDARSANYDLLNHKTFHEFVKLLSSRRPDVLHLHGLGRNIGLSQIMAAQQLGVKTILTFHQPGFSCLQRSLMNRGKSPCDGEVRVTRCTACRAEVFGHMNMWLAAAYARIPTPVVDAEHWPSIARLTSGRSDTAKFQAALRKAIDNIDAIHVLAEWSQEVLKLNGAEAAKIHLLRTALPNLPNEQAFLKFAQDGKQHGRGLRLAYWGRVNRVKGLHVLLKALKSIENPDVTLSVFGIYDDEKNYVNQIKKMIDEDKRVTFRESLSQSQLSSELMQCDLAIIPSIWFETGPLTVLEAWAVGLPVIGSDLGGIQELCRLNGGNILVLPNDDVGLAAQIRRIIDEPSLLSDLKAAIKPPKVMKTLAREIYDLYRELVLKEAMSLDTA